MPTKGKRESVSPARSRSKSAGGLTPRQKRESGRSRSRSQSRSRSKSPSRSSSRSRKESKKDEGLKDTKKKASQNKSSPEPKTKEEKPEKTEKPKEDTPKKESPKKEDMEDKKTEKKSSIGRQSTPPRPRPARDLESPTRSSLRIREKQSHAEATSSKEKGNVTMKSVRDKSSPASKDRAFGGPIGAAFLILSLPLAAYLLNFVIENEGRSLLQPGTWFKDLKLGSCFDQRSALIFLAWFLFQTVLAIIPFGGKKSKGLPLRGTGKRLAYNCNGFFALIVSLVLFASFSIWDVKYRHGKLTWFTYVVDHYFPLMVFASLFSFIVALLLYTKSMAAPAHALAPEGSSGIFIYDFFMGRELNPRISTFDLKFFCEFRPGLIGWVFLDMAFCVKFWQLHGQWSPAMILVTLFHLIYVGDALFYEEAILSTMDITHEGFGFMLVFGDLVWVPFTYTLTTRYLLLAGIQTTSIVALIGAALLCAVGYWIFRASNSQKDLFRRDPKHPAVSGLTTVGTSSGRRLLAGGWWGLVRHPNYLGDIIMSVAWSVPCGVRSILPWFYPAYLAGLLVSRELRDERACAKKHGHGWQKYQEAVPYRIVPRVF